MKTSTQVIRVSAVRAREGAASLSSWLDSIQVRPLTGAASAAKSADDDAPGARDGGAATAELSDALIVKFL